jgi:hypothetical protein
MMAGFTSSKINYGDFYSGNMQPPVIANGLPTQSAVGPRPSGIASMYGSAGTPGPVEGSLSLNGGGGGLTNRSVHTVPIDMNGNPVSATQAIEREVPSAPATGPGYGSGYVKTDNRQLLPGILPGSPFSAPAAPSFDTAGSGPGMWADLVDMFGGGFLNGDPGVPTNVGGDNGAFGVPAQGFATEPNPPPTSIAHMYAPLAPPAPAPTLNVTKNINRFLSEQGQNTAGMTAGEQANAFRKSMGFGP